MESMKIRGQDKITGVNPDCHIDSDRQGPSNPKSNRSLNSKALKPKANPMSKYVKNDIELKYTRITTISSKTISREAPLSDKSIIVGILRRWRFLCIKPSKWQLDRWHVICWHSLKLIPKSWLAKEHIAHVDTISCAYLEALDTVCCMSVSSVSVANFTESANFTKAMIAPDCKEWKDACDSKISTLDYSFFGFWVQCILLFKHFLSFGLSEHKQNCKIVERCLSRTIRSYALLVSHFQTTVAQHQ